MTAHRFPLMAVAALAAALVVGSVSMTGGPAAAKAAAGISWEHEGYAAVLDAAADAKAKDRRLLLGLSGSPS